MVYLSLSLSAKTVQRLNAFTTFIHLANAIVILSLALSNDTDSVYKLTSNVMYTMKEDSLPTHTPQHNLRKDLVFYTQLEEKNVPLSLTAMITVLFTLSIIFQAGWIFYSVKYQELIESQCLLNTSRYIEYSMSAFIMVAVIALQVGVWDMALLFTICMLTFISTMLGLLANILLTMENTGEIGVNGQTQLSHITPKYIAYILSHLCIVTAFVVIWGTFIQNVQQSNTEMPLFVWFVLVIGTFTFLIFGTVQHFQLSKTWSNNKVVEVVCMSLSLTTKFILGWILYCEVLT